MLTSSCQILLLNCRISTNTRAILCSQLIFSLVNFSSGGPVQGPELLVTMNYYTSVALMNRVPQKLCH